VIGDVRLGEQASVWPCAVLRGDSSTITVGARTSIQDGAVLHCTTDLTTSVGADCVVVHSSHLEGCVVEDGCLIGSGSVLLHRVVVRSGGMVAAGAVVAPGTEVPSRALAVGVPARMRPDVVDPATIEAGVANYLGLAERFRQGLRRLD